MQLMPEVMDALVGVNKIMVMESVEDDMLDRVISGMAINKILE